MAGKISELTPENDPQDVDELEFRDDSETPDTDAQNKAMTVKILKGLSSWKQPVRAATTTNGTLATAFENDDTIDGVSLVTGDRILLKDQTAGAENGIYTVEASGAPTRATDFDTDTKAIASIMVPVEEGTANADKVFQLTTNNAITIGTTALVFAEFGAGGGTKTISFPIVEMVPEGTVGTPDIHAFATAGMQQDGWLMVDGASDSKINLRGYLPPTLAATPNMKIIVMIVTLGVVSPAEEVHITIDGKYRGDGEDLDVTQDDVTLSADITLGTTTETLTIHTFDPATDPVGNDVFTFIAARKPANAGDTFTDDILVFIKGVVDV